VTAGAVELIEEPFAGRDRFGVALKMVAHNSGRTRRAGLQDALAGRQEDSRTIGNISEVIGVAADRIGAGKYRGAAVS
jgi:hypothetical protein